MQRTHDDLADDSVLLTVNTPSEREQPVMSAFPLGVPSKCEGEKGRRGSARGTVDGLSTRPSKIISSRSHTSPTGSIENKEDLRLDVHGGLVGLLFNAASSKGEAVSWSALLG